MPNPKVPKGLPDGLCIDSNGFLRLSQEVEAEKREQTLSFLSHLMGVVFIVVALVVFVVLPISFTVVVVLSILGIMGITLLWLPDFLGWG